MDIALDSSILAQSNHAEMRRSRHLGAALLVGLTALAYLPALRAGFIWDDPAYVTRNVTLRSLGGLARIWLEPGAVPQYYPLVHTVFWVEYHLWGLWAPGYHVVNVLLHAAAAMLLWRGLRALELPAAWLAAAVFAIHPVNVESVAWVTERKNVLSGLFYFASFLCYWRGLDPQTLLVRDRRRYFAALGLFVLALLSKTVTCSLPAAILVLIWWKRGRIGWRDLRPLLPMFVVGLLLALMTAKVERDYVGATGAEFALSFSQKLLVAGRAVWFYAGKVVAPVGLAFIYPKWDVDPRIAWQWLYPLAAAGLVLALLLLRKRIGRGALAAMLIYGGTLLPALGFFAVYPMRFSYVADHFQYHACAALIAFIITGLARLRPFARIEGAVLLGAMGTLTWFQCLNYRDAETLWRATLKHNPDSWMVLSNLGTELAMAGKMEEANGYILRARDLARNVADVRVNAAQVYASRGELAAAEEEYRAALSLTPNFPAAYYGLGRLAHQQGRLEEAKRHYEQAIAYRWGYGAAHFELGAIAVSEGDIAAAQRHFAAAVADDPDHPEARFNLAAVLINMGRPEEARPHLEAYVRLRPDDSNARELLARIAPPGSPAPGDARER